MLTYFVFVPILIAVFLYLFPLEKVSRVISIVAQAGLFVAAFYLFYLSRENDVITVVGNYEDVLGIILMADMLSAVFILLTAFIFLMAAIYSFNEDRSRLFWFLLFIWEGTMIGVFLAGDLFNLFVLTEVATVLVAVLILYNRQNRSMYDGMIYLMINVVVIQFYLFGLGFIYRLVGILDMMAVAEAFRTIENEQLFLPYALIMTFVALKCALMPLFSWLPKAHGTPGASAAVSAVLSGLHIKSGIYLFIRFQYVFEGVALTQFFLVMGLITAVAGVIMALSQTDIKLVLAYSTIAQIGLIIAGFNIGGYYNHVGSLFHVINHAVFKAALFLGAGMIIHTYDTRDINKVRGVFKRMPVVGVSMGFAILGMIGMPLFNGSRSKYFIMYDIDPLLNILLTLVNLGTIMVFIKYSAMLFGSIKTEESTEKELIEKQDKWQLVSMVVLGGMCLALGIMGEQFISVLFGVEVVIDMAGYLLKAGIFAASLVAGYFIFTHCIKNNALIARVRNIDLGFREMCIMIGVFFGVILITAGFL